MNCILIFDTAAMLDYRRQQTRKDHDNNVSVEKNANVSSVRTKGAARHAEEDVEEVHLNLLDHTRYYAKFVFAFFIPYSIQNSFIAEIPLLGYHKELIAVLIE